MGQCFNIQNTAFMIGSTAMQAMLYEVSCYPSPGLVSAVSQGAHRDMDYYTFLDSTSTLLKPLILCAEAGLTNDGEEEIFHRIRQIGIEGEKEMFKKTKGVNTHKGMLFLLGVSCAAVANTIYKKEDFREIRTKLQKMTVGLVDKELKKNLSSNKQNLSNGEKLFLKYGTEGIRGEVEKGLPIIFDFSLDFYKRNEDLKKRERLVQSLIGIMQYCEDSTILHRHSPEVLAEVQQRAKEILALGGMKTKLGREKIEKLDEEFSLRRISPGGSADLLACTVFFYLIEQCMNDYIKL